MRRQFARAAAEPPSKAPRDRYVHPPPTWGDNLRRHMDEQDKDLFAHLRHDGSLFMQGARADNGEPMDGDLHPRGPTGVPVMSVGSRPTSWCHPSRISEEMAWMNSLGQAGPVDRQQVEMERGIGNSYVLP